MGGDVKLFRSGAESLTVEGSVEVSGALEAEEIKVNGLSLKEFIQAAAKEILGDK